MKKRVFCNNYLLVFTKVPAEHMIREERNMKTIEFHRNVAHILTAALNTRVEMGFRDSTRVMEPIHGSILTKGPT